MSVYVTGDCHGDFRRFKNDIFPEQKNMTRNDTVIICGDFGGVWAHDKNTQGIYGWNAEAHKLDVLESKPFTTVFCDGNHENFDRLENFPVKEWNGGLVHEIRPHVLHLMRGQVYVIEGEKFFVFGGASSHDIRDGILDPSECGNLKKTIKSWINQDKQFRIKGYTWWPQESLKYMDPDKAEMQKAEAVANLDKAGWSVRFVISHEMPASTVALFSHGSFHPDEHSMFLEDIRSRVSYFRWFSGHYHDNKQITEKDAVLYEQIIRIL